LRFSFADKGAYYCLKWLYHWADYLTLRVQARQRFVAALDSDECEVRDESPVIVVGMHRSGTSLTSTILQEMGVSMGFHTGKNSESSHFLHRNMVMFDLANASWDNPGNLAECFKRPQWITAFASIASIGISQENNYKCNSVGDPRAGNIWGFKDPRNSFTLPAWIAVFPQAKVINVIRNPSSVSRSLVVRGNCSIRDDAGLSLTSIDQSMAMDLWADYVLNTKNNLENVDSKQKLELHYEELTKNPELSISKIAAFLELEIPGKKVKAIAKCVAGDFTTEVDAPVISDKVLDAIESTGYSVNNAITRVGKSKFRSDKKVIADTLA